MAVVTSRLDYCDALYVGLPLGLTHKLKVEQNTSTGLFTGVLPSVPYNISAEGVALAAYMLRGTVQGPAVFKVLNNVGPGYPRDCSAHYIHTQKCSLLRWALLRVECTPEMPLVCTRSRAFSVPVPAL